MSQSSSEVFPWSGTPLTREVGVLLRSTDQSWGDDTPHSTESRTPMLRRVRYVYDAITTVTGDPDYSGAQTALEKTEAFIQRSYDTYEGLIESPQYDWVFAVPSRGGEDQSNEYASEVTPFLPLLDPRFGVDSGIREHTVADLAPSVIETYRGKDFDGQKGAIVWTPVDLASTGDRRAQIERVAVNRRRINDTAGFVRQRLGATVMGLGAVIPSITQLGKTIKVEGLTATTGHGGTVYLITETVKQVIEQSGRSDKTIGILGVGSIGGASLEVLRSMDADYSFTMYDSDISRLQIMGQRLEHDSRLKASANEIELLDSADIIVTAINQTIDLDQLEHRYGHEIDLTGKVIIDDSQPACFNREQVEARGGAVVWVVGQDTSKMRTLHREAGYNFGETAGLYGLGAVWGCEAEAAAISLENRRDLAVLQHVTPEIAISIGALCRSIDVKVASPMQSFGRPATFHPGAGFALASGGL